MTLDEELNEKQVWPVVKEGKVTLTLPDGSVFKTKGRGFLDSLRDESCYVVWWVRGEERACHHNDEWHA